MKGLSISSKVLEYTAQIQQLLDKINAEVAVGDFKTPTTETPKTKEVPQTRRDIDLEGYAPPGHAPTSLQLTDAEIDVGNLDYLDLGKTIKPKKFLGDLWAGINENLKAFGYEWVKDGKNGRWEFQIEAEGKSSPTVTSRPIKTDEIKWNIKDGAKIVEARATDPKTWAFVKKYDRDAKKSTDEVKSENLSLYEYLKTNKEYVDSEYKYTMSKDEAFFNREKL